MTKLRIVSIYILAISALTLQNCSHQYYAPNAQQVPLFTEKNDWQIAGYLSSGPEVNGEELLVAHSLTSHLAVTGMYSHFSGNVSDNTNYMRSDYGEIGFGYFTPIKKYVVFEILGGMGLNGQHHQYDSLAANLRFTKYFIQPVFGFKTKNFEVGVSCRTSYINFTHIQTSFFGEGQPTQRGYLFLEPAFTIRAGGKHVKFQLQRQLSRTYSSYTPSFYYSNSMLSLGVQLVLPWKTRKGEIISD